MIAFVYFKGSDEWKNIKKKEVRKRRRGERVKRCKMRNLMIGEIMIYKRKEQEVQVIDIEFRENEKREEGEE